MVHPAMRSIVRRRARDGASAARRSSPRGSSLLLLLDHLLGALAEHVLARLLVERLLDEFADCQSRLHLRPRANVSIPALDVRIVVEREALRLVGHGPGK